MEVQELEVQDLSPLALANGAAEYALSLADHLELCANARWLDEVDPPRYAAQRVSWTITQTEARSARVVADHARRYAMLAARLIKWHADEDAIATAVEGALVQAAMLTTMDEGATLAHEMAQLEAHGHGRTLKTKANRAYKANGGRVERIRDNEREVEDNYTHGSDYAAMSEAQLDYEAILEAEGMHA